MAKTPTTALPRCCHFTSIGKASFSLASGATATLKVKLSAPALKVLKSGKVLKAKLSGTGIAASAVKLKAAKG